MHQWKEVSIFQSLPENPTVAQIKSQKEQKMKRSKAKACLFAAVSPMVFTRIMSLKSAKEIWNYLKTEYEGDERIRGMQVLNLIKEFELQRMEESETVKEYSDRLLSIANKVRLLGSVLKDSRIVEKLLVTITERFEYNNPREHKGPIKNFSCRALKCFTSTGTKKSHETRWSNRRSLNSQS